MLNERLQILVSSEQRRRLETEARRRGASVGSLIREAVDARYGSISREDRVRAVEEIGAMEGSFLTPAQLNRLAGEEHDAQADEVGRTRAR